MFRPWLMQWAKRSTFCFQIKPCSLRLCMCVGELSDVNTNEFITPATDKPKLKRLLYCLSHFALNDEMKK